MTSPIWIWLVVLLSLAGILTRPFRLPEAVWAVLGAVTLVFTGSLSPGRALHGVALGSDVYLFLAGMMLLSEMARVHGLFDWLAARAMHRAGGSPRKLFFLIYGLGVLVTVFLSNDATAVVLTPAVLVLVRSAGLSPLPYLFVCAFTANAASFVLPISNPANLVLYGSELPPLIEWFSLYALPSAVSISLTLAALYLTQRNCLPDTVEREAERLPMNTQSRIAAGGIVLSGFALLAVSARGMALGWPTFLAAAATLLLLTAAGGRETWKILSGVSWQVVPLVAGLFVLTQSLIGTGLVQQARQMVESLHGPWETVGGIGLSLTLLCNLANNLPVGLLTATVLGQSPSPLIQQAGLLTVDLSPNLSVTGSLATVLWLLVLRREEIEVSFWQFFRVGLVVMPPALIGALLTLL